MRYTVDVVAPVAFGADIYTLERDSDDVQRHLDQVFWALFRRRQAPFPCWRFFPLPSDRPIAVHLGALRVAVRGFIAAARARLDAQPALRDVSGNMIEAMISARDQPASKLTDKDVAGDVLTMLLAGEDTTAHTLASMIYLRSRNPERCNAQPLKSATHWATTACRPHWTSSPPSIASRLARTRRCGSSQSHRPFRCRHCAIPSWRGSTFPPGRFACS